MVTGDRTRFSVTGLSSSSTLSSGRAPIVRAEPLVRGGTTHAERVTDVLPRVASVMCMERRLTDDDPKLLCQLVSDEQTGERISVVTHKSDQLLTTIDHPRGLQHRISVRRAENADPRGSADGTAGAS